MAETMMMTMTQLRAVLAAAGVSVADDDIPDASDGPDYSAFHGPGLSDPGLGFSDSGAGRSAVASKDRRIAARIDDMLYERARSASGIARDSDLVRAGLEALADPDEFGSWLAARRGALPRDFAIDL